MNQLVKVWKDNKVSYAEMEFSCGGDSMNDYSFNFYDKNDKNLGTIEELENYFDREVFNEVQFYEASDGHYQGEFGKVVIQLDESDEDDENHGFIYSKQAQSEWSETYSKVLQIELTKKEQEVLKEFVNNINGSSDDVTRFNYKTDFVMTEEIEDTLEKLGEKISEQCGDYDFVDVEGERSEWFTFTTDYDDNDTNDLIIKGNTLSVQTNQQYDVVRDSDD